MSFHIYFNNFKNNIIECFNHANKFNVYDENFKIENYFLNIKFKFCNYFNDKMYKNKEDSFIIMKDMKIGSLYFIKKKYTIYEIYEWGNDKMKEDLLNNFYNLIVLLQTEWHILKLTSNIIDNQSNLSEILDNLKKDFKDVLKIGINKNIYQIINNPIFLSKFLDLIYSPGFKTYCTLKIQDYKIEIYNKLNDDNNEEYEYDEDDEDENILESIFNLIIDDNLLEKLFDFITIIKYNENKVLSEEIQGIVEYFNILNQESKVIKDLFQQKQLNKKKITLTNITNVKVMDETLNDIDIIKYFKIAFINNSKLNYTYPIFLNKLKIFSSYLLNNIRYITKEYNGKYIEYIKSVLIKHGVIEINTFGCNNDNIENVNLNNKYVNELSEFLELDEKQLNDIISIENIQKIKNEILNIFNGKSTKIISIIYDIFKPLNINNSILNKIDKNKIFDKFIDIIETFFNYKIDKSIKLYILELYSKTIGNKIEYDLIKFKESLKKYSDDNLDAKELDKNINLSSSIILKIDNYFGLNFCEKLSLKLDDLFNKIIATKIEQKTIKKLIFVKK